MPAVSESEQPESKQTDNLPAKPRTSKLAVAAFVMGLLSIPTLSLTALPAVICGFLSLIKIARSSKRLKGTGWALGGMAVPVVFVIPVVIYLIIGFFQDAPPIPNDYIIADLYNADPQYNASYELLCSSFTDDSDDPNGAPAIGLNREDIDFLNELSPLSELPDASGREQIKKNIDQINRVWEKAAKGRNVIEQLQQFPVIADLEEPDLNASFIETVDLKYLGQLYCYYAMAQLFEGKQQDGMIELLRLNQVARAMSVPCRSLIKKLVCYALIQMNLDTAVLYLNDPNLSQDMMNLIETHFQPFTDEQVSLKDTMICEHIICRNELRKLGDKGKPLLKYHSTLRISRNFKNYWIKQDEGKLHENDTWLDVWPAMLWFMPRLDNYNEEGFPWYYTIYNPIGSSFILILEPAMGKIFEIKTKIQIKDNLFQHVLARRLGQEGDLTARAYGENYIVDVEKKRIYSPGPDGVAFTDDDIWLPIEPTVLGLTAKEQQ